MDYMNASNQNADVDQRIMLTLGILGMFIALLSGG